MSKRKKTKPRNKEAPNHGWPEYLREGWVVGSQLWGKRYKQYLSSAQWKAVRSGALDRSEGKCALCSATDRPLEVHHTHYLNVGKELVEDVRVLCSFCHRLSHGAHKTRPIIPLDAATRAILRERAENPPPKQEIARVVVRRRVVA